MFLWVGERGRGGEELILWTLTQIHVYCIKVKGGYKNVSYATPTWDERVQSLYIAAMQSKILSVDFFLESLTGWDKYDIALNMTQFSFMITWCILQSFFIKFWFSCYDWVKEASKQIFSRWLSGKHVSSDRYRHMHLIFSYPCTYLCFLVVVFVDIS